MAAADDDRSDLDAVPGRAHGPVDGHAPRSEHPPSLDERCVTRNIERVADKVKGLLRSDG